MGCVTDPAAAGVVTSCTVVYGGDGDPGVGLDGGSAVQALRRRHPHGVALRDTVTVTAPEPGMLRFLSHRGFQVDGVPAALRDWVAALADGRVWSDLLPAPDGAETLLGELVARGMVAPLPADDPPDRLTKQRRWLAQESDDPDGVAARIGAHEAVVVGCGGTGSLVAVHLAAMGVGSLLLVDHDAVEITNLNRQFTYSRSDIGRPKTEALREFVVDRYPECRVSTYDAFLDALTADDFATRLPTGDWTAFCCADRPVGALAAVLAELTRRHSGAVMFGAAGLHEAAVGPLLLADGPATAHAGFVADMHALAAVASSAIAEPIMSASIAPVNTVTAAWMVSEWLYGVVLRRPVASAGRVVAVNLADSRVAEERAWR